MRRHLTGGIVAIVYRLASGAEGGETLRVSRMWTAKPLADFTSRKETRGIVKFTSSLDRGDVKSTQLHGNVKYQDLLVRENQSCLPRPIANHPSYTATS